MATKKATEDVLKTVDEPVLVKEETDPWKIKKTIFLPKALKGEDNFLIASVNMRNYKIRRGESVDVPLPIAQMIENSFRDADKADEYIEKKMFE